MLNVRNGALLVKGGSLQTTCNCCDSWVCCDDPSCLHLNYDIRFTLAREAPPGFTNIIPQTPYVGVFLLPYIGHGRNKNDFGVVQSFYREWKTSLPFSETCGAPEVSARVSWSSFGISFGYSLTYNRPHLTLGNASVCDMTTKSGGTAFAGGCGIPHRDKPATSPTPSDPGFVFFLPPGQFFSGPIGRMTFEFVER